jgi:hypothetical protein
VQLQLNNFFLNKPEGESSMFSQHQPKLLPYELLSPVNISTQLIQ